LPHPSPTNTLAGKQAAAGDDAAEPRWQWFCYSNVVAVVVFTVSMTHVLRFWLAHGRLHSAGYFAFGQPAFAAAVVGAIVSLLYFIAFCGVAFIASDVDALADGEPATAAAAAGCRDMDADVVIVGAGTAGASMATVLARQGKRVTLIERCVPSRRQLPRAAGAGEGAGGRVAGRTRHSWNRSSAEGL
jgi:hypothetical protein